MLTVDGGKRCSGKAGKITSARKVRSSGAMREMKLCETENRTSMVALLCRFMTGS